MMKTSIIAIALILSAGAGAWISTAVHEQSAAYTQCQDELAVSQQRAKNDENLWRM